VASSGVREREKWLVAATKEEKTKEKRQVEGQLSLMWQPDVDRDAWDYMKKQGRDVEVEPPPRMTTRS
jgi:hypothetical protein